MDFDIHVSTYAQEAKDDLPYINKYKDKIIRASNNCNVQPSVVAGIISRETRGGRGAGLDSRGFGDGGNAYGLMQVDKRYHTLQGAWDSQTHIEQGIGILQYFLTDFDKKCPRWSHMQKLKGALAAYNMGTENMDYNNVDGHTTGRNYSTDVLARAEFFKRNGYY